jgi:hypothetical protein
MPSFLTHFLALADISYVPSGMATEFLGLLTGLALTGFVLSRSLGEIRLAALARAGRRNSNS